jgi:hypothetical protein
VTLPQAAACERSRCPYGAGMRRFMFAVLIVAGCHHTPRPASPDPVATAAAPQIGCAAFASGHPQVLYAPTPGAAAMPADLEAKIVEGHRVEGVAQIPPSDDDRRTMWKSRVQKLFATVKLCLSETGVVNGITLLRPSGLSTYDRELCEHIKLWRYQPYELNGTPIEVCTGVSFVYDQPPAPAQ